MDLEFILSVSGTALGIFITLLTFILKLSKNKKVRRLAEQMLAISNQLSTYVEEAECFTNYSGDEKKNYVLTKMNQFAIDNNIKFDSSYVSTKLEELINVTKKVNVKTMESDWLD